MSEQAKTTDKVQESGQKANDRLEKPPDANSVRNATGKERQEALDANPNKSDGSMNKLAQKDGFVDKPLMRSVEIQAVGKDGKPVPVNSKNAITEKDIAKEPHPTRMMPAMTPEAEAKIKAEKRAKHELISQSAVLMAVEAQNNPRMEPVLQTRIEVDKLPPGELKDQLVQITRQEAAALSPEMRARYGMQVLSSDQNQAGTHKALTPERLSRLQGHIEKTEPEPNNEWEAFAKLSPDQQKKVIEAFQMGSQVGQDEYQSTTQAVAESIPKGFYNAGKAVYNSFVSAGKFVHDIYFDHESAVKTGGEVGEGIGKAIVAGVKIFQLSSTYAQDVQQSGDYTKPFQDMQTIGNIINEHWNSLPLERRTEKGSELIAGLGVGSALGSVDKVAKSGKLIDALEQLGGTLQGLGCEAKDKAAKTIGKLVDELLQPIGDTGTGMKMPIPKERVSKDANVLMSKADDIGESPRGRREGGSMPEKFLASERFVAELEQVIETLSEGERGFLVKHEIPIKPVRRIQDIKPDMDRMTAGIYDPSERTIYIAEEVWSKGEWRPNSDVMFELRHEFGHAYNAKSHQFGSWISDKPEFINAYRKDVANLAPKTLDELRLSANFKKMVEARDEVFADMYAHSTGLLSNNPYSQKLKQAFPNCLKFLKEM